MWRDGVGFIDGAARANERFDRAERDVLGALVGGDTPLVATLGATGDLGAASSLVQAIVCAAEHGIGLGVVPAHSAADALHAGRLVSIATRRRPLANQISLLRLPGKVPSRLEREFVASVVAALRQDGRAAAPRARRRRAEARGLYRPGVDLSHSRS